MYEWARSLVNRPQRRVDGFRKNQPIREIGHILHIQICQVRAQVRRRDDARDGRRALEVGQSGSVSGKGGLRPGAAFGPERNRQNREVFGGDRVPSAHRPLEHDTPVYVESPGSRGKDVGVVGPAGKLRQGARVAELLE